MIINPPFWRCDIPHFRIWIFAFFFILRCCWPCFLTKFLALLSNIRHCACTFWVEGSEISLRSTAGKSFFSTFLPFPPSRARHRAFITSGKTTAWITPWTRGKLVFVVYLPSTLCFELVKGWLSQLDLGLFGFVCHFPDFVVFSINGPRFIDRCRLLHEVCWSPSSNQVVQEYLYPFDKVGARILCFNLENFYL